jgi:hypothetical protein
MSGAGGAAGMPPKKEETVEERIRRIRSKNNPNQPQVLGGAQDENSVARMMQML